MTSEAARSRGTAAWLARLPAFMHHHVALEDQIDIDSLVRFLCGRAIGFVAAGGGSFGTAHVGIYKAFRERGVMFDIFVGTSVGSAMVAGFAKNLEAEHLERGTHEIFVRSRSFRRPTWPRYSLLDHKAFDRALAHQYGPDCRIEDCWRPFAAVATNLSTHNLELIRTGPLWQAVRASSAIPGLLPPFYTPEGAMLVDGCLIDNVPLTSMHQLKSGPNLVVHFGEPAAEMFDVDYAALPGRFELIAAMLTPFRKKLLPAAPSAVNVLWRSLVAHQRYDTLPVGPFDTVMRPPSPVGVDVTDFDRHTEIFEASYRWAKEAIAALEAGGSSAIAAMLDTGALERSVERRGHRISYRDFVSDPSAFRRPRQSRHQRAHQRRKRRRDIRLRKPGCRAVGPAPVRGRHGGAWLRSLRQCRRRWPAVPPRAAGRHPPRALQAASSSHGRDRRRGDGSVRLPPARAVSSALTSSTSGRTSSGTPAASRSSRPARIFATPRRSTSSGRSPSPTWIAVAAASDDPEQAERDHKVGGESGGRRRDMRGIDRDRDRDRRLASVDGRAGSGVRRSAHVASAGPIAT